LLFCQSVAEPAQNTPEPPVGGLPEVKGLVIMKLPIYGWKGATRSKRHLGVKRAYDSKIAYNSKGAHREKAQVFQLLQNGCKHYLKLFVFTGAYSNHRRKREGCFFLFFWRSLDFLFLKDHRSLYYVNFIIFIQVLSSLLL